MFHLTFLEAPRAWQVGFQEPATPVIDGIINLHNYLIFYLVGIAGLVIYLLYHIVTAHVYDGKKRFVAHSDRRFTHSTLLEVVWTLTPVLILIIIAYPSFGLLYSMDELVEPEITLKVVGHQWYWSYEYSDREEDILYDSYIIATEDLVRGIPRLLEVDERAVLPVKTPIRILVTAADVLHSWAIPSLGIKVDACPGRLNQVNTYIARAGSYYGQCSEICGVNHAFIPIVIDCVNPSDYEGWVEKSLGTSIVPPIPEEDISTIPLVEDKDVSIVPPVEDKDVSTVPPVEDKEIPTVPTVEDKQTPTTPSPEERPAWEALPHLFPNPDEEAMITEQEKDVYHQQLVKGDLVREEISQSLAEVREQIKLRKAAQAFIERKEALIAEMKAAEVEPAPAPEEATTPVEEPQASSPVQKLT